MLKGTRVFWGIFVAGLLCAACGGGGGTNMVDSWKEPSAGPVEFTKVAVFFLHKDRTVRGIGEEEMVRHVKSTAAVPSIALFPDLDRKDVDRITAQLKARKFDGAIVMRILNVDETVTVSPGIRPAYYVSFTSYYNYLVPALDYYPGLPSKEETDRKVTVETVVYSLIENRLIWVGMSETSNPDTIRELITGNAPVVARSLRESGVLR